MMRALLAAIGFLTRVPVHSDADAKTRAASLVWYPSVGLLIGGALALLAMPLADAPPLVAAALLVLAWTLATGALHLDGLADSADAWVGGLGDRERTLAIMKDPRSGPIGVAAVVLVLMLKFAALATPDARTPALLLAPVAARAVLIASFLWVPYVRREGLGSALAAAPRGACVASLVAAATFMLAFGLRGVVAAGVAGAIWFAWRRACVRRLGGFTGDAAGALVEIVEATIVVAVALS